MNIYQVEKVPIEQAIPNPSNPRTISDERFAQLVKSIQQSPWMLKLRPIVVNKDNVILGGNQRYKACLEAKLKEIWVLRADKISHDEQRRFILKDNMDYGKWDKDIISQQYTQTELEELGMDFKLLELSDSVPLMQQDFQPELEENLDDEPYITDEELEESKNAFRSRSIKQIVFNLPTELYEEAIKDLDMISKIVELEDNSEALVHMINFYEENNASDNSNIHPE